VEKKPLSIQPSWESEKIRESCQRKSNGPKILWFLGFELMALTFEPLFALFFR
jgi:hypothetical protein